MRLFGKIAELLSQGNNLVLATVVDRSGSAPRAVGSRMVVRSDGSILGTIGGGILEARVRNLAEEVSETRSALSRSFTLTAEDACGMGMICGGQVRVLVHHLDGSDPVQSELYGRLSKVMDARRQAWLVTRIPREDGGSAYPGQGLLERDDFLAGSLDPYLAREIVSRFGGRQAGIIDHGEESFLVEPLGREGTVVIFGAGHVSRELAPLVERVGFRTVVCDDREEFANRDRFPSADQVVVLHSFHGAMQGLDIGEESYLVLVTRGHAHDKTVLAQALATNACYIGMIGSRRKREAIYQALLQEGFTPVDLSRVCSPIGLDIGAETPEEIAVSIVAELIQARARRKG